MSELSLILNFYKHLVPGLWLLLHFLCPFFTLKTIFFTLTFFCCYKLTVKNDTCNHLWKVISLQIVNKIRLISEVS